MEGLQSGPGDDAAVYRDKSFESNDGFSTRIWGPPLWHVLHTMSFNYPVKPTAADKEHYATFILILAYVLPCGACRRNFPVNLRAIGGLNPADLADRHAFSYFVYRLHNEIHQRTAGRPFPVSYPRLRQTYECFRSRCAPSPAASQKEAGCVAPAQYVRSRALLSLVPMRTPADEALPSVRVDDGVFELLAAGEEQPRIP